MKKLLLITGDLATGKSTFAHMLSRRYRIPVFCKDTIKEEVPERFEEFCAMIAGKEDVFYGTNRELLL